MRFMHHISLPIGSLTTLLVLGATLPVWAQTEPFDRPSIASVVNGTRISDAHRIKLPPKYEVKKAKEARYWKGLFRERVIVKFHDGPRIRAANPQDLSEWSSDDKTLRARLTTFGQSRQVTAYDAELRKRRGLDRGKVARDLEMFRSIVNRPTLARWGRVFQLSPGDLENIRRTTEKNMGRQASDLANYFFFEFEKGTKGERIASEILKLASVEDAYLAPIPRDAQAAVDIPPTTLDFQDRNGNPSGFRQRYLRSAPRGIDAFYAWTKAGGTGEGMRVIDIENGWILDHEDLPTMFYQDGRVNTGDGNHGTATMSVMVSPNNGYGVTGIAHDAEGGVGSVNRNYANTYFINVGDAIIQAKLALNAGDVIVIEQHAQFLIGQENCTTCITEDGRPSGSCGLIAMEYWHHIFDAIAAASAAGVIVVEAAGNGQQNLDHDRYDRRFDRNWRNSGAIVVGAGTSSFNGSDNARFPMCFTNHGSRLDLQGWGQDVMAAGYGEAGGVANAFLRPGGGDNRQWYRSDYNGTSSASPVVAGAVLAVQGVQRANGHPPLNWLEVRNLLRDTGQPQRGTQQIGPLPDLHEAIDSLEQDFPPPQQNENGEPVPVVMENELRLQGPVRVSSGVAGVAGNQTRVLDAQQGVTFPPGLPQPPDLNERVIEGILMAEKNDKPCFVTVDRINAVTNEARGSTSYNICRNNNPTERSKWKIGSSGSHTNFVTGLEGCLTRNSRRPARLKGVRIQRSYVSENGTLTPRTGGMPEIKRPNCNNTWISTSCPAGSVATQLIVHTRGDGRHRGNAERSFSGLQLGCQELVIDRVCTSGCN